MKDLRDMTVDELVEYRYEIYDRAELVDRDTEVYELLRSELKAVQAVERLHEVHLQLQLVAVELEDIDPDAFADAVLGLARLDRELAIDRDVVDLFAAAFEVAETAAKRKAGQHG